MLQVSQVRSLYLYHIDSFFRPITRGMVSIRMMAMALMVVWGCLMTASEENWKWYKPYTWMSSAKSSHHPAVYGKPLPRPYISPGHEKHRDRCELRKVVFTQDAESPQVSKSCRSGSMFRDECVFILYKLQRSSIDLCAPYVNLTVPYNTRFISSTLFFISYVSSTSSTRPKSRI